MTSPPFPPPFEPTTFALPTDAAADLQAAVENAIAKSRAIAEPEPISQNLADRLRELAFDWSRWLFAKGPPPLVALNPIPGDVMIDDPRPRGPGREGIPSPSATHSGWHDGTWLIRSKTNRKLRRAAKARR